MSDLIVRFQDAQSMDVRLSEDSGFSCSMDGVIVGDYEGSYVATPSAEQQTLPTSGKILTMDIVVEPIPSNYGLITWNGSTLTVS